MLLRSVHDLRPVKLWTYNRTYGCHGCSSGAASVASSCDGVFYTNLNCYPTSNGGDIVNGAI